MFIRTLQVLPRSQAGWLLILVLGAVQAGAAEPTPQPDTQAQVDRELVVRFTRAYGMAKQAFKEHAQEVPSDDQRDRLLQQPEQLDQPLRGEVTRILDLNGLEPEEWQMMLARMQTDDDLRERVESLSVPFE